MSVRAGIIFENNAEGTQKAVHINLGWFSPSDFELAGIMANAATAIDPEYKWDRAVLPIYGKYIPREDFEVMSTAHSTILTLHPAKRREYMHKFTLSKKLVKL